MKSLAVAALAAVSLAFPAAAGANDAHLVVALLGWSKRITADAQAQSSATSTGKKDAVRRATQRVLADAVNARRALSSERPSSADGRRCRGLAVQAFDSFAGAERELLAAFDAAEQKDRAGATRHARLAQQAATRGAKLLGQSGQLAAKLKG